MAVDTFKVPTFDVTTLGETMLRYSVAAGQHISEAQKLTVHVGGSESNVGAVLAQFGQRVSWASALPDNQLGDLVLSRLRATGLNVSNVARVAGSRVGTYYIMPSALAGGTTVIYDRSGSAFSLATENSLDMNALLSTRLLHGSGITPALGPGPRALLLNTMQRARAAGVTTSFDINFREKLWNPAEASEVLRVFVAEADVLFCSARDAARLFGAEPTGDGALKALRQLSDARSIVITLGQEGALGCFEGERRTVPAIPVQVLDRPGAGDALVGGVLNGILSGQPFEGLRQGVALAAMALTSSGDMLRFTPSELAAVLSGAGKDIIR